MHYLATSRDTKMAPLGAIFIVLVSVTALIVKTLED